MMKIKDASISGSLFSTWKCLWNRHEMKPGRVRSESTHQDTKANTLECHNEEVQSECARGVSVSSDSVHVPESFTPNTTFMMMSATASLLTPSPKMIEKSRGALFWSIRVRGAIVSVATIVADKVIN